MGSVVLLLKNHKKVQQYILEEVQFYGRLDLTECLECEAG